MAAPPFSMDSRATPVCRPFAKMLAASVLRLCEGVAHVTFDIGTPWRGQTRSSRVTSGAAANVAGLAR
jgi:hypothetical protein